MSNQMIKERKLELTEELQCEECGGKYIYDLFWQRQYSIKMKDSPLNTKAFHSLCPEHKLAAHGQMIIRAYAYRLIDDRDIRKMGLNLENLLGRYCFF